MEASFNFLLSSFSTNNENTDFEVFNYYRNFTKIVNEDYKTPSKNYLPFFSVENSLLGYPKNGTVAAEDDGRIFIYNNASIFPVAAIVGYNTGSSTVMLNNSCYETIANGVAAKPFFCKKIKIKGGITTAILNNPSFTFEYFKHTVFGKVDRQIIQPQHYISPQQVQSDIIVIDDKIFEISGNTGFKITLPIGAFLEFDFYYS